MSEATYEESPASTDSFFGNIHMTQESRRPSMIGILISSSPVSAELSVGDQVQLAIIDHRLYFERRGKTRGSRGFSSSSRRAPLYR